MSWVLGLVGHWARALGSARHSSRPDGRRSSTSRAWRVGHVGRDGMYYEELIDGTWQRLPIEGEMLMSRAHHVIYFASDAAWTTYPAWAQGRRDEIIARIKQEFPPPDYEYHDA